MKIEINEYLESLLVERKRLMDLDDDNVPRDWEYRFGELNGAIARWIAVEYFRLLSKV